MLYKEVELFTKYVSSYNLDDINIERKFKHSLRVMNHSILIAKSLQLSERGVKLVGLIGLLHDIGRFFQWQTYHTFSDSKSIDHGDKGVEILKRDNYIDNYLNDIEEKNIMLNAVKYHNKISIDNELDDKNKLFCKIVRDADKIDIMKHILNLELDHDIICNVDLEGTFNNRKLLSNNNVYNDADAIVRTICFIYDINTSYAIKYILDKHIIEKKIDLLNGHVDNSVDLELIKNELLVFLKKKCDELWQEEKE